MAYASLEELQAGWRELDGAESDRAEVLLDSASRFIDCQTDGRKIDEEILCDITCNLVRRAIGEANPVNSEPEWSQVTSPYAQTFTPAKTLGDFYLTKWEKKMLGIAGRIGCASF